MINGNMYFQTEAISGCKFTFIAIENFLPRTKCDWALSTFWRQGPFHVFVRIISKVYFLQILFKSWFNKASGLKSFPPVATVCGPQTNSKGNYNNNINMFICIPVRWTNITIMLFWKCYVGHLKACFSK